MNRNEALFKQHDNTLPDGSPTRRQGATNLSHGDVCKAEEATEDLGMRAGTDTLPRVPSDEMRSHISARGPTGSSQAPTARCHQRQSRLRSSSRSLLIAAILGGLNAMAAIAPTARAAGVSSGVAVTVRLGRSSAPAVSWGSGIYIDSSSNNLAAVSCGAVYFCAAVDGSGNALTFDGTRWKTYSDVDSSSGGFETVSCVTRKLCWAADGQGFFTRFNGRSWSAMQSEDSARDGGYSDLHLDVSCPSAHFCAAVDVNGGALLWRAGRWSRRFIQGIDTFESIGCGSPKLCVAGEHDGEVVFWNGSRWSAAKQTTTGDGISAVGCWSDRPCVAGTEAGELEVWNGSHWSHVQQLTTNGSAIEGVACYSSRSCLAVDGYGEAYSWNGSRWLRMKAVDPNPTPGLLPEGANGLSCASGSFCAVVNAASNGGYAYFRAQAPRVTTDSLPKGRAGSRYRAQVHAKYGPGSYHWRVSGGKLPKGLHLASGGLIQGKPAKAGTFRFTISASDSLAQSGRQKLTIIVSKH